MINWLLSSSKNKQQLIFHILLGWVSLFTPFLFILWYYAIFIVFFQQITKQKSPNSTFYILIFLMYSSSFEILGRMVKASPYVPYELGKYVTFILIVIGLFKSKKVGTTGMVIFLFLLPSILLGLTYYSSYKDMIFNVLGIVNIALGIALFAYQKITTKQLLFLLRLLVLPLTSILAYSIIRSPNFEDVTFELGANNLVGGFGSNQIATIFGIAFFVLYLLYNKNIPFSGFSKWFDILIIILFLIYGLLTFSRGGMLAGFLGVFFLIYFQLIASKKIVNLLYAILAVSIFGIALYGVNEITDGNLLLRYSGETHGTIVGSKEKDLNQLTSGRSEIFFEDLDLFNDNIFLGVGVSQSVYKRNNTIGTSTHVEFSRLLSEHGLFGLLICIIFIYLLVIGFINGYKSFFNSVIFILYFIGFFTTFHAATRTFVSPLFMPFIVIGQLSRNEYVEKNKKLDS